MKPLLINILLLLSAISISCNRNVEDINDFKGIYKIKSISSSLPVDLNNDGHKSYDYLQEIKSPSKLHTGEVINYGYDNENQSNFAEARPTHYQTNNTQFLDIRFPVQRIRSFDDNVKFNMEYWNITTGFIYHLTENNVHIESDPFNHFEFYEIDNFQINRLNNNIFEISFNFKLFDFSENEWIETNLNAVYEKIED